jgi:hypothetical protein
MKKSTAPVDDPNRTWIRGAELARYFGISKMTLPTAALSLSPSRQRALHGPTRRGRENRANRRHHRSRPKMSSGNLWTISVPGRISVGDEANTFSASTLAARRPRQTSRLLQDRKQAMVILRMRCPLTC